MKQKKHKVVKFHNGVARIYVTRDLSGFRHDGETTFVNPILTHLRGVSPEFWTVKNGQIVAMSLSESALRGRALMLESEISPSTKGQPAFSEAVRDIEDNKDKIRSVFKESNEMVVSLADAVDSRLKALGVELEAQEQRLIKLRKAMLVGLVPVFLSVLTIFLILFLGGK